MKILAPEVFTTYASQFNFSPGDGMVLSDSKTDANGITIDKYIQYHNGYAVQGTMMNVISKRGVALFVNGFHLPNFHKNTPQPIAENLALNAALQYVNAPKYAWEDPELEQGIKYSLDPVTADTVYDSTKTLYPKGELVVAHPYGDTAVNDTSKYALCWKFFIHPMRLDTILVDTSSVDSLTAYATVVKYVEGDITIIYVDAVTGLVYTKDPNKYGCGFWVSVGINPTSLYGNQNVQMSKCSLSLYYYANDARSLSVRPYGASGSYYGTNVNWNLSSSSWKSPLTGYFCLEKAWDYFDTYHGFSNGPVPGGTRYNQILSGEYSAGGTYFRTSYSMDNFTTTGVSGRYNLARDYSGVSFAEMDLMAHEYTHALIAYGPRLNHYGDAGSICEGLCDIYGTYAASHTFPSRYYGNWTNGFGYNISGSMAMKRSFANPASDIDAGGSAPSSSYYGDALFTTSVGTAYDADLHKNSGLIRKWFHLLAFGGTHHGIHINQIQSTSNLESDVFDGIPWMWSNLNYYDVRNQYSALYKVRYGYCSDQWRACVNAWAAVGVGPVASCPPVFIHGPFVIGTNEIASNAGTFTVGPTPPIPQPGGKTIISYNWIVPQPWTVSYNLDHSSMTLTGTLDYSSQIISCIVTYSDLTTETLSTFLHIVDDGPANKGMVEPKIVSTPADGITYYPNPMKSTLNVILQENPATPLVFRVMDLTGRQVFISTLYSKSTMLYIPSIAPGLYLTRISGDGMDYVRKLTVQ